MVINKRIAVDNKDNGREQSENAVFAGQQFDFDDVYNKVGMAFINLFVA